LLLLVSVDKNPLDGLWLTLIRSWPITALSFQAFDTSGKSMATSYGVLQLRSADEVKQWKRKSGNQFKRQSIFLSPANRSKTRFQGGEK
jgi:hypothetical protein